MNASGRARRLLHPLGNDVKQIAVADLHHLVREFALREPERLDGFVVLGAGDMRVDNWRGAVHLQREVLLGDVGNAVVDDILDHFVEVVEAAVEHHLVAEGRPCDEVDDGGLSTGGQGGSVGDGFVDYVVRFCTAQHDVA